MICMRTTTIMTSTLNTEKCAAEVKDGLWNVYHQCSKPKGHDGLHECVSCSKLWSDDAAKG